MLDKIADALNFEGEALKLRARRQEVLTSNIANADTPNYKAVDFNFSDALKSAVKGADRTPGANHLHTTHTGHISNSSDTSTSVLLKYREAVLPSVDGNTVDIEHERGQFAENSVKYEAALRSVRSTIKALQSAISGSNG
jgi:flagellar basal-body rod protein FlgB